MNVAFRNFAGGEIAPSCYGRTDTQRYQTSLRTCRNFIVQKHGGVVNRPGTQFVAETKDSTKTCRIIKFVKNRFIANTYLLEFGDRYVRFFQNGAAVLIAAPAAWVNATTYSYGALVSQGGVNYVAIVGHVSANGTNKPGTDAGASAVWYALTGLIYELPTPYVTADLMDMQVNQSLDTITIVHPSYAPRELTRTSDTLWTLSAIIFGPSILAPINLALTGGGAGAIVYFAVTAVKEKTFEESLPIILSTTTAVPSAGTPTTLTWDPVLGAISYNIYRSTDGATYGLVNSSGGSPIAKSTTVFSDSDETATSAIPFVWALAPGQVRSNPVAAKTNKPYDGAFTIKFKRTLVAGGINGAQGRVGFYYSRDGEARVLAAYSTVVVVTSATTNGPVAETITINVPDNGYTSVVIDAVPEVQPFSAAASTMNVNTLTAPENIINWNAGPTTFIDSNSATDKSIAPPSQPQLFNSVNNFPATVTRYQQRRLFANTNAEPARIWASRTGVRNSFTYMTPLQDDDPITFELDSRQANSIVHLLDLQRLLAFTDSAEQVVDGEVSSGILKPDAINARNHSYNGANRLSPIVVNNRALYVQARANSVCTIKHDDLEGSINTDLGLFSTHLFQGKTLVDWDFALTPNSVVWIVRSDGCVIALTFIPSQDVWGWHRHDTDGNFENVCVIPENNEDAVYVVVNRTINGATKRYIERMSTRYFATQRESWFVDCGKKIDGLNTTAITMTLTGATFTYTDLLTITASAPFFAAGDAGTASIWFTAADGSLVEVKLENFTSTTVMTGHAARDVPADLRNSAKLVWTRASRILTGLTHLEGKKVSILGDGFVVASPNNVRDYPSVMVVGGSAVMPQAYKYVIVGLPFIADLETLDIDVAGPVTAKDRKRLVSKVVVFFEKTLGIWAGQADQPTAADPLNGLDEFKVRDAENFYDPTALITDDKEILIQSRYNSNGRVLLRQVEPLPASILMIAPVFSET